MSLSLSRCSSLSQSKSKLSNTPKSANKVLRFKLPHDSRIKDILEKYVSGEYTREYELLVCSIRDNDLADQEILSLLKEVTECVSMMNQNLRLFVEAILVLKWTHRSETVKDQYKSFLINLLCAHNYHTKFAIDQLVQNFIPVEAEKEWSAGIANDEDCEKFGNIHSVLNILLKVIPMSRDILFQSIISLYPYLKKTAHQHESYLHNLLWIIDYQPELRLDILNLIFKRLIILDVNAPKYQILQAEEADDDEIFSMDEDKAIRIISDTTDTKHPIAHILDICLDKIINFLIAECYNLQTGELYWDKAKSLYQTLMTVFDKVILPTYNSHHVQFPLFFFCSFKITLSEGFLTYLWKKVCDPSVPSIHRTSAVGYIASFLARASFVNLSMIKSTLQQMSSWIHTYISTQDGLECVNSDVRVHSVFYSICQALFYVVAFRYRDLVSTKKNITFLESLNLAKMVTCRLNPLKVCQPAILQNFAAVTRTYQLAYCYSVIEHNTRNVMATVYIDEKGSMTTCSSVLDAFFPFDPCLLKRCGNKFSSLYLEYKGADEDNSEEQLNTKVEEDDDFLNDSFNKTIASPKNSSNMFSYSASPGFKYKSK